MDKPVDLVLGGMILGGILGGVLASAVTYMVVA